MKGREESKIELARYEVNNIPSGFPIDTWIDPTLTSSGWFLSHRGFVLDGVIIVPPGRTAMIGACTAAHSVGCLACVMQYQLWMSISGSLGFFLPLNLT